MENGLLGIGPAKVWFNMIITDLCVFAVAPGGGGLVLKELHPGVSLEEVRAKTGCDFLVAS